MKLLSDQATKQDLIDSAKDLDGNYIKFVVDIKNKLLVIGGNRHFLAEELLLENGSEQDNLWGGGFSIDEGDVDYSSMINIRPSMKNYSKDLSIETEILKVNNILLHFIHPEILKLNFPNELN